MLLVGQFDSPFVRRVAIALHHYGLAYEHRPWSVWAQADAIAKHNPLRRVPILVMDDGETLIESAAILDALDDLAPGDRRLIAQSGPARRGALRVCALATGVADKAVSLLYERVLRKASGRNAIWTERCEAQIRETLDVLEKERGAAPGPYWFGSLTHADIAVTCALRFVSEAHPNLAGDSAHPSLAAHARRCEAMPLFQSAAQALRIQLGSSASAGAPARAYFLINLVPPRATFMSDMHDDERSIMREHVAYWTKLIDDGIAIAFGPVADPKGGYGVGIVEVAEPGDVKTLEAGDPAIRSGRGFRYDVLPMPQAVVRAL